MNVKQSSRYHRRRLVRGCMLAYTRVAAWIPQRFPDFMCIGAPRAATTWVHKSLADHPEVFLPRRKEVHFYDERPADPGNTGAGLRWSDSFYFDVERPAHLRWYWHQYRHAGARLAGDITPLYSTLSAERIGIVRRHMPDLRLIYILRNPIDRAWSGLRKSAWYQKGENWLDGKDEDWLLKQVMRPEVLIRGNYPRAIDNWESVFPADRFLYLFFDDVTSKPEESLDRMYNFLGIAGAGARTAEKIAQKVNAAPERAMPDYVRQALQAHYAKQVESLESRFKRDLSHWLE